MSDGTKTIRLNELINGKTRQIGSITSRGEDNDLTFDGAASGWLKTVRADFGEDAPNPYTNFNEFADWADVQFNGAGFFVDVVGEDDFEKRVGDAKDALAKSVTTTDVLKAYGFKATFRAIVDTMNEGQA